MRTLLYLFFLIPVFLFSSCDDTCDLIECGPNGECDDGTCRCDPGYEGAFCETQHCSADFFVGTFEGDLKGKSLKEKHYVARFTKVSETDITIHYQTGGTVDLELDLENCRAYRHVNAIFWMRTITVNLVDEGIEFRLETENCDCTGILIR